MHEKTVKIGDFRLFVGFDVTLSQHYDVIILNSWWTFLFPSNLYNVVWIGPFLCFYEQVGIFRPKSCLIAPTPLNFILIWLVAFAMRTKEGSKYNRRHKLKHDVIIKTSRSVFKTNAFFVVWRTYLDTKRWKMRWNSSLKCKFYGLYVVFNYIKLAFHFFWFSTWRPFLPPS